MTNASAVLEPTEAAVEGCPACKAPAPVFVGFVRLYGAPGKPGSIRRCINPWHGEHRGKRPSVWVY